ncbi:CoA ester lyase [Arthrobacter sp. EpRS71]|uniref:HpcH/HpaI aldolase/citrate lyase family protein n=1 Tax=Arthrobacter sp. EpRS71 TaxID=1743141 RepID=UPI000748D921|nr:CoA ester lyase [Arthrobacter sp. EpRS71]KUM42225.1 hypothetical protein AR689_01270 [Arthrobacter sp. EpRS71]
MTTGTFSSDANSVIGTALTALFVPGDRPERFAKALVAGADVVILDLEDAVQPANKEQAREQALTALGSGASSPMHALVRINPPGSPWFDADLKALQGLARAPGHGLLGVMIPKSETAEHITAIVDVIPTGLPIVPLVESALGIINAFNIATLPGVSRLAFGAVDYTLDIAAGPGSRVLDYPRSVLVVASRAAGIAPPLDTPSTSIHDLNRVADDAGTGKMLGFGGKMCIHPAQLPIVRSVYMPTKEETEWAKTVLAGSRNSGAASLGGEMIDLPVLERAKRLLVRSGSSTELME